VVLQRGDGSVQAVVHRRRRSGRARGARAGPLPVCVFISGERTTSRSRSSGP
jgi:hypothetical protein